MSGTTPKAHGMPLPFFTIGHSNRPPSEFFDLLAASQVGLIVDVRAIPRSRTNPQYNCEPLAESLGEILIAYAHLAPSPDNCGLPISCR